MDLCPPMPYYTSSISQLSCSPILTQLEKPKSLITDTAIVPVAQSLIKWSGSMEVVAPENFTRAHFHHA